MGSLQPIPNSEVEFLPLIRTGTASGVNGYFSLVRPSPFGPQLNPSPPREQDDEDYVVAARIRSKTLAPSPDEVELAAASSDEFTDAVTLSSESNNENVNPDYKSTSDVYEPATSFPLDMIVVADLDFVGEQFFAIRAQAPGDLNFDNVTFFLNAIDTLLGD